MKLTGRFAPSPTGPLHMGSLVTAMASYLDIKSRGGKWYVRIDDLDPPRQDPEAIPVILESLEAHGLHGDKPVDYQSQHTTRYQTYFDKLQPHLFYCRCTRKALAQLHTYPGTCREFRHERSDAAVRVHCQAQSLDYDDGLLGAQRCAMAEDYGDFIVRRRDNLWAYNFATAVDDGLDASHVLRGQDLLHVTPQQLYVMDLLELDRPAYTHIPLLCFDDGTKLSKQTHAPALDNKHANTNILHALYYLGLQPPRDHSMSVAAWLAWGLEHWLLDRVPAHLPTYQKEPF